MAKHLHLYMHDDAMTWKSFPHDGLLALWEGISPVMATGFPAQGEGYA